MVDKNIKSILKAIGDENTSVLEQGLNSSEVTSTLDTGSYIFNAVVSGSIYKGIPGNKITILAGESAVGKTYFALGLLKSFQEQYPDGIILFCDTESAVTRDMMNERGLDAKRILISEPITVQEFKFKALKFIEHVKENPIPAMIVLDSMGNLSTNKEVEDSTAGKDTKDMTRAALIKGAFRVLNLKLAQAGIPLIATNHVYDSMAMYAGPEMGGGKGPKYSASTICMLTKAKVKEDKNIVGSVISVTLAKSRFTKEFSKIKVLLTYDKGLDKYYGLLDICAKYDIIKKVSTRYELPDGTKLFESQIYKDPERVFTTDILDKIDQAVYKEYKYGSALDADL